MVQEINANNFKTEVEDYNDIVVVDFYANWCGPCKMLAEVFETVAPNIDIDILKVDVDKFPDIAKEYAIMSIPTLFLFENNQIKKTHTGYLNPNELINFLK